MNAILSLLAKDARLTPSQLSTMTGIPEAEVSSQIDALVKAGVIKGYKTLINWDRTEENRVTALIELKVSPKRDLGFDGIAKEILSFSEVESVYLMSGGYDLAVTVVGDSFQEIAMFVARRLSPLDSVLSTATHFLLKKYKESGVSFLEEDPDERRPSLL